MTVATGSPAWERPARYGRWGRAVEPTQVDRPGGKSSLPPDEVLVEQLRAGDETAFRLMLDAWSRSMLRLARSFVSTNATAEEVLQDTWLAVIRGLDGFQGRASLRSWVYRILINTAKDRGRKESRTLPWTSLAPEGSGPTVEPTRSQRPDDAYPGHWCTGAGSVSWLMPEGAALAAEVRAVIAAALEELPTRQRAVVMLRDVEGYEVQEVCSLLEISHGNQRVLLYRGRTFVRDRLKEYLAKAESDVT